MAIQFAPKSPSVGENIGGAIGEGLDRLIQHKIADLRKNRSIAERKETYKKAKLPEWLAELDEKQQELFLKEFDFLPPDQQQNVSNALNSIDSNEIMDNINKNKGQQLDNHNSNNKCHQTTETNHIGA